MRLESVRLRYARRGGYVLDGVTLELAPGTVTAVVGGNGSGKSSLLRLAAGLARPDSGTVSGRPERIGYVPERLPAGLRLSARGYLRHMGRIQGLATATAAARSETLLDRLALEGDREAPVATLSKGNAQKVALAQALLAEPGLLVLDEPWSGLDADAHRTLTQCLAERRTAGAVVLLTEHRPGVVAATADAVHRLQHGKLTPEPRTDPPAAAGPPAFTITLAGTPEDAVRTLPGVRAVDGTRLLVDARHSDAVLAELLRRGHSVRDVRHVRETREHDSDHEHLEQP
ncbi:ABC transporter ATP-binding protein [Kitasatospora sp. NPDC002040]|uniref:ABC transporter ATP-binding protein n=1 Tax=Kitasatospora sp. NPDC002040 TaxID=3154661 RepID=UPI00332483E9